jgi:surfeit locus 1 family protein
MESAASAHDHPSEPTFRFRLSLPVLLGILGLAFVVLVALGSWQVLRQREANAAESERNARIAAPPIEWRTDPPLGTDDIEFRRLRVSGRWDNAHTMIIANVARYSTRGIEVVTPLLPDRGGPAILVNRGWIPLTQRDRVLAELASEERATVEGLGRAAPRPEGASIMIVGSTAGKTPDGSWAWFDIPSIARELPYEVVPWRLVQGTRDPGSTEPPPGLPIRFWGTEVSTSPHTEYAVTWFSLAIALAVIAGLRLRADRRPPRDTDS